MPTTVYGLPIHPLVVHAAVVLVPLAAIAILGVALVPRLRPVMRWPLLALLVPTVLSVPAAILSGRGFRSKLLADEALGGTAADIVDRHATLGQLLIWTVLLMALSAVALLELDRRKAKRVVVTCVAALAVLTSVAAIAHVARVGHLGSEAVWSPGG